MSRKVLKSMKEENPDLQKQIGCINGFFQLFDRHRFLTGGSNDQVNELGSTKQKAKAKTQKVAKEKQQFSTESSITSMSTSSCSSSMSSIEFSRTVQVEPPSIPPMKTPDIPSSGAVEMKQLDTSIDKVRDSSKHKEAQGLSVKTVAKEGKKGGRTLKYIDSPRPMQTPKSVNTGVMVANEPFHILAKSHKTPWDSPRLSYDGRDVQDTFKSGVRHKELPRLSLDSKQGSITSTNEGTKSRNFLKGPQKGYGSSSTINTQLQEPETSRRQSSVVAKLMGLETFPDYTQTCEASLGTASSCTTNKRESLARSSTSDEYTKHRSSGSPGKCKGSSLPQSGRGDSTMNGTRYSRFSLEPTPWKQPDASQGSQSPASKGMETAVKASNTSHSVYGEIEKRLANLEFKKSGKDLRALKQILEAMQRYKDSLDITSQASDCSSDSRNNSRPTESSKVQSPRYQQKDPMSIAVEKPDSSHGSKLPIVIMKPAKVKRKTNSPVSPDMSIHGKSGNSKRLPGNPRGGRLLDQQTSPRSAYKSDKMRTSKVPQDINGENINSGNKTGTESPGLHKKFGLERRSLPASSSSNRRQHNRQSIESSSQSTTPRPKFSLQEANERFSKNIYPRRDFKDNVDAISPDFDRNKSLTIHSNIKIIHTDQSEKISSTSFLLNGLNQNNAAKGLSRESSMAETIVIAEQPSPVSVLDPAFYRDDPPSPIKKKSDISKDSDEAQNADDEMEENSADHTSTTKHNFSNGACDRDLNTQKLIQKLQQFDCTHDKQINFSEPTCDSKDPDHKYVSEILFASGLLGGPGSSQTIQSSPHLNNAKLFLALEQIKTNKRLLYDIKDNSKRNEQIQRKLIFDVVYDILVQKLILGSYTSQWILRHELAGRKLRGQQLLYDICSEVDKLQHKSKNASLAIEDENSTSLLWEDLTHSPTNWTNCQSEMPDIVLDIERLIFKDLITEVVRGEVANHPGKHCRQLQFLN
ncbi:protein LONGIFOLIA 1-like [Senna tora]|uniref:Protein LONGIFOLIA 1-like n=1 Tax=Senna tora TaxID=362788 RepID=A0A834VZB9_9FABA|nr:protein LONGIFOLIA 1-like [Senna tora]